LIFDVLKIIPYLAAGRRKQGEFACIAGRSRQKALYDS
jgi:hypothetical protein